jgi:REP element-mobilizing transposase RayT
MLFKNKYRIESARLKEYDYSFPNWYYVTINTKNHREFLGRIISDKFVPNIFGKIVEEEWNRISEIRSRVDLDYYVIMPNHIHGIVIVSDATESKKVETHRDASLQNIKQNQVSRNIIVINNLSNIIRGFKGAVTKRIHLLDCKEFEWQSRFYDHIIRNEVDLCRIREYIEMNPLKWSVEKNNLENLYEV